MFIYEKDGKLNMILGEEGKRQFPWWAKTNIDVKHTR